MAADTQETSSSEQQQPETWDAQQCEAALAHLERLQEQLDKLRSTIPSLVSPLARPQPDGTARLFAEVRKAAAQANGDIQIFRDQWNSEQTQKCFARSKQSRENDEDLTKAMDVAKWGWSTN